MPYNTRRKSLSLPSLGIHVPMSNAARAAAAAALANRQSPTGSSAAHSATSSASSASSTSSSPTFSPRSPADRDRYATTKMSDAQTPARKIKRSRSRTVDDADHSAPAAKRRQADVYTPPPSPKHSRATSVEMHDADDKDARAGDDGAIDLSTVKDEIVEAVIVQLQATRNRPHIVKELAAVLMKQLKIVQQSANPAAIISSRLSGYLKRPCWNAHNPCPMAKELENVHPRRTYFYLTTTPHQPLPDTSQPAAKTRELATPSATSASEAEEEDDERRRELSPSPEVDLSAPEFDDMDDDDVPMPGTPIGSLPGRHNSVLIMAAQAHRGNSPPLEKDEKEFTQTADGLQKRKLSGGLLSMRIELSTEQQPTEATVDEHNAKEEPLFDGLKAPAPTSASAKEETLLDGHKAPAPTSASGQAPPMALFASPAIRPFGLDLKKDKDADSIIWAQLDGQLDWDRSPETVELDELDRMLTGY